jgi:hypothetical protein
LVHNHTYWYVPFSTLRTSMYWVHTGTYRYIQVCTKYPDFLQPVGIPDVGVVCQTQVQEHQTQQHSGCSQGSVCIPRYVLKLLTATQLLQTTATPSLTLLPCPSLQQRPGALLPLTQLLLLLQTTPS